MFNSVRDTAPVGAENLCNSELAEGCVVAWFASSMYDHAGGRVTNNGDKVNCLETVGQYGKVIKFSGTQPQASVTLANKTGWMLDGATAMTVIVAGDVTTGAARTLLSATGTITADNSWSFSTTSTGALSLYISNASSSSRTYKANTNLTSGKRGVFAATWRAVDDVCALYVDGVEIAGTKSGSARPNIDSVISLPISIGAPPVATNTKLNGSIEWVIVFNRALNPSEIREITDNPYQILQPSPQNEWLWWFTGGTTGGGTISVNNSTNILFNTLNDVNKNINSEWNTLSSTSNNVLVDWNTLNTLFTSNTSSWNISTYTSNNSSVSYDVLNNVNNPATISWNTSTDTSSSLLNGWNITSSASISKDVVWDILSALSTAQQTLTSNWDIVQSIANSLANEWSTLTSASASKNTEWGINDSVQQNNQLIWAIANNVANDLAITGSILGDVANDGVIRWDSAGVVAGELLISYSIVSTNSGVVKVLVKVKPQMRQVVLNKQDRVIKI